MKTKVKEHMASAEEIKTYCLKYAMPADIWNIQYDKYNLQEWREDYPTNSFDGPWKEPQVDIAGINFPELIKRLKWELQEYDTSGLHRLRVNGEMALACVRLTLWLLENERL